MSVAVFEIMEDDIFRALILSTVDVMNEWYSNVSFFACIIHM